MNKKINFGYFVITFLTVIMIVFTAILYNGAMKNAFNSEKEKRGDFTGIIVNLNLEKFEKYKKNIFMSRKVPFRSTGSKKASVDGMEQGAIIGEYNQDFIDNIGSAPISEGKAPSSKTEAVISIIVASNANKEVGDTITFEYSGKSYTLRVSGILKGVRNLWTSDKGENNYLPGILVSPELEFEYEAGNIMYWVHKLRDADVTLAGSFNTNPDKEFYVIRNPIYESGRDLFGIFLLKDFIGSLLTILFLAAAYYSFFVKKRAMKMFIFENTGDETGYRDFRRNILKNDLIYMIPSIVAASLVGILLSLLVFNRILGVTVSVSEFLFEEVLFLLLVIAITEVTSLILGRQEDYQKFAFIRQKYKKKSVFDFLRKSWIEILFIGGICYLSYKLLTKEHLENLSYVLEMTLTGNVYPLYLVSIIAVLLTSLFFIVLLVIQMKKQYDDINVLEKEKKA